MQHEPYENGFTWRAVAGAFFVAFVMLPGVIFMGLMIGQDLGTAADWVTIILFMELARRSFVTMTKQELYMLRYTVSHLSHIAGGLALGGGIFAHLVYNRYLRNSDAFATFDIAHLVPDWFSPQGDAAYESFLSSAWRPVIIVTIVSMILSKLTQLSLGYLAFKLTSDVEKLPFPLAPIHAEGAIALAERSQEKHGRGFRQYCFSVGVMIGAAFGIFYVAIPTLSMAFLKKPIHFIPIPFIDLTSTTESILPGASMAISLNLGLLFTGFVMPWRIVLGSVFATIAMQIFVMPVLCSFGYLPSWAPGKDAIQTSVAQSVDMFLSMGIGVAFAIFFVGVWGMVKGLLKYRAKARARGEAPEVDLRNFWKRDVARGDPPTWAALAVWLLSSAGFVWLSNHLINGGLPYEERFSVWWLIAFAFLVTPINTYVNARMAGIAGQHAGVPFLFESAIFLSRHKGVAIWFAPLPLHNYGGMADFLKQVQLTRTRFTSILKAELLIFPLMLVASFIFWSYVVSLGPVPSEAYPFVQKFWPQHAQMKALWASSMQEGSLLLTRALKPMLVLATLVVSCLAFVVAGIVGFSTQYLYGFFGGLMSGPSGVFLIFTGALLGRFVFARKYGKEKWQNYAPILAVGFSAGMGLMGMLSIAINFLVVSVGTGY
jgi:hypothetical protein